jgi:hypothetical protein
MLTIATALTAADIDPAAVRLLRHHKVYPGGRTPYSLWRDHCEMFERYQSTQDPQRRRYVAAPYWASVVVPPADDTLFVGLYAAALAGSAPPDMIDPPTGMAPGSGNGRQYDLYNCRRLDALAEYVGRLSVDWGPGTRSWVQRGDGGAKPIVTLTRKLQEERFSGFTRFVANLSELEAMPQRWQEALLSARGIYLLACPRTYEHYVGQAACEEGFLGRWHEYVASGHGGNVGLRLRDPSDYQVSVLEVLGTNDLPRIGEIEALWKRKLLSRNIGLNLN